MSESSIHSIIERRGFALFPAVFSQDQISKIFRVTAEMSLLRSRAGIRHALRHPDLASFAQHPRLLEIARQVLGPDAFPYHATLFDKSPQKNWLVVWHQDTALPLGERRDTPGWGPWSMKSGVLFAYAPTKALNQILALRVHLDDSFTENGPLRVLPCTHNLGVLTDDAIHDLASASDSVHCIADAGGILAMKPLLIHSSSKSMIDAPRRVLHIEYAASEMLENGLRLARD